MYRRAFLALTASLPCFPVENNPSSLNGRWDLTVPANERKRAWWLEIKGADTPHPSGSFIGAPGGNLDRITNLAVTDGEARWSFGKGVYRAHIGNGKLVGVFEDEGKAPVQFYGTRAPKF